MNLHNIVQPYITTVNPNMIALFYKSTGYSTDTDGSRVASFADPLTISCQWQSFQYNDLVQLDGLNINGEKRALYLNGDWDGVSRPDGTGGDLIVLTSNNTTWVVCMVLENWQAQDGWVKVAVVRQNE